MQFHMWERFSSYDTSVDEAEFARLIEDNFVSASMERGTQRNFIEKIGEVARVPIKIEFLSGVLADHESARGHHVFSCPGDHFDMVARSYPGMLWWLTENGLNMDVRPHLLDRFATRLNEFEALPPQKRGFAFEAFLDSMFAVAGLSPRKSFRIVGEQIDGSFELEGNTYLVEAKWQDAPIGARDLRSFAGAVRSKSEWTRGLFVSNSGFSEDGLTNFRQGGDLRILCLSGADLRDIFAYKLNLVAMLQMKIRRAGETGLAYVPVKDLMNLK